MVWTASGNPATHQDVQDAVKVIRGNDPVDPLALTTYNPFTSATQAPAEDTSASAGYTRIAYSDARLTYSGAAEFTAGGTWPDTEYYYPASLYPHNRGSQNIFAVEFFTDAPWVEFQVKYSTTGAAYRLLVDDRRTTEAAVATTVISSGYPLQYRFDFPTAAPRRIRIELAYFPFNGIYIPSTSNLWKVPAYRDRTLVLGDSITGGSGYNLGWGMGTWLNRVSLILGWDDVWCQAIGGTGYITANAIKDFTRATGVVSGSTGSLNDIAQYDYAASGISRVIIFGGYNDSAGNQATISTAAALLYQNLKAAMPADQIVVIGCFSNTGSPPAGITNTDNTLQAAAAAAGLQFISPLTGRVYNQRGTQIADHGAWITTANAAAYISTGDNVHPNDAGHVYLARRIADAFRVLSASTTGVEPWAGGLTAAIDDGRPSNDKEWNYLSGPGTLATLTPTLLTTSVARCWSYNCQFSIVVNRLRWWGVAAVSAIYKLAVYRLSDGVQVIGPLTVTTTADAWNSVTVPAVTLAPNTPYIVALSVVSTGTTAGLRTGGTPLVYPPLQASTPGALALSVGDHRFWFGQFAVTSGVLPSTLPTLVRGTGWTAGLPLFFFDSNSAA
jgi:hypothetical protein